MSLPPAPAGEHAAAPAAEAQPAAALASAAHAAAALVGSRHVPGAAGQASVELVAVLPLALLVALAIAQLLAAGAARELAGNAAEAGAVALLQGTDPAAAARAALPGWSRERAVVRVSGRHVAIRIRPRTVLPLLADRLSAVATADAGPRASAPAK
jgi:hypothetical protein